MDLLKKYPFGLKPCPFTGEKAKLWLEPGEPGDWGCTNDTVYVGTEKVNMKFSVLVNYKSIAFTVELQELVDKWNTRV